MKTDKNKELAGLKTSFRLIPFILLGLGIFALNSSLDLNYFLRGYLVLLESQVGIVILYFVIAKIVKRSKRQQLRIENDLS